MAKPFAENTLYYGDNLDVLRRYFKDETVDLIYLDPPFNSNQDYNVLFAEKSGACSAAQIKAFEDTWRWDQGAALAYPQTVEAGGTSGDASFPTVPRRKRYARLSRHDGPSASAFAAGVEVDR